jgi:hypothetical protein
VSAALQTPAPVRKAPAKRKKRRAARKTFPGVVNRANLLQSVGPTKAAIASGKVERAEWRDPDDTNPHRREAKVVEGYRASDNLVYMHAKDCIGRGQMRAGQRLRKAYELAEFGISKSNVAALGTVHSTGTPDGPSELRMINIERFNAAREAIGRLTDVIIPIVCRGLSIREYSDRYKIPRAAVSARLIAGLDVLISYYERLDAPAKATSRGSV